LFWLHLIAGLSAGLVIAMMAFTGVMLGFERQALALAERDLRATDADAQRAPLPVSRLVAAASAVAGDEAPTRIVVRSDAHEPLAVTFGRDRTLFVHRTTGAVLGEGAKGLRRFFAVNEDLHRSLAMKTAGKKITGVANLVFLFIVLSGLWIWIPRVFSRATLRHIMLFKRGVRGRARDYNWHNVLGIWSFVPLVLIVFSGVVISFPWASALVYRALGSEPPKQQQPSESRSEAVAIDDAMFDAAITAAARVEPHWQSISVRLPLSQKKPVSFALDAGSGARPDKRSQLMIDPRSGALVEHKTYASQNGGQKARAWLRWIHTGEAGGIAGQLVATVASGAAVVLAWTGIALALRRFRQWLRQRQQRLVEVEA
jgi:uncharacterized iron-regulated membrane protein